MTITSLGRIVASIQRASSTDDVNTIREVMEQNKSIVAKAKDAVMVYPAILDSSVGDYDLMFSMTKYLEMQYAIFTLLSLGLNPVLDSRNNEIKARLNDVSAESLNNESIKCVISYEANNNNQQNHKANNNNQQNRVSKIENNSRDLEKRLKNSDPTLINVQLYHGNHSLTLPLAIKVNPHIISDNEMNTLLEKLSENSVSSIRFIKAITGEISFIKDFLLHMDTAKRDTELYKIMGRHPWYQQLQKRKGNSYLLNILKLIPFVKKLVKDKSILPTTSIITTKDTITNAMRRDFKDIIKIDDSLVNKMMTSVMLLSMGIYNPVDELFYVNFNGLKRPITVSANELSKGTGKDPIQHLSKALDKLTSMI